MQNNKQSNQEKIDNYLALEEAKSKALYPYSENSVEPTLQGAWRGSLLMGIPKTLHESHKNGRLSLKSALAYYGAGALLGGATGNIMNRNRVKEARAARRFLVNHKMQNELNKVSAFKSPDSVNQVADMNNDKPNVKKDIVQGGLIGGAMGMLTGIKGGKYLKGGLTGAILGSTQSGISDEVDRGVKDEDKKHLISNPALMGISMGVSSASEPLLYRAIGKGAGNRRIQDLLGEEDYSNAIRAEDKYKKMTPMQKVKTVLLPNMLSEVKGKHVSDDVDMMKGARGEVFDKQLLGHTAGKALWGGVIGYGLGKVLDKLQHKKKNT